MKLFETVVQPAWSDLDDPNVGRSAEIPDGSPKAEMHWAAAGPPRHGHDCLAIDPQIGMEYCNNARKMNDLFDLWKYCFI